MARVSSFICQVLALTALVANSAVATDEGVLRGEVFGGPHGTKYSDMDLVSPGQTVKSVTIRSGERVNAVCLTTTNLSGVTSDLYHGGDGGDTKNTLTMGKGEYITGVEAHWGEKGDHTRVQFIRFTTNANNTIEGGSPTENIGTDSPEGYQLGGFFGTSGKELDSVGMLWTSLTPV